MNYEKSCGAVIWRSLGGKREYLIILNKKSPASGHWGFPKGHIEADESEADTARREILEEVGLKIESFIDWIIYACIVLPIYIVVNILLTALFNGNSKKEFNRFRKKSIKK